MNATTPDDQLRGSRVVVMGLGRFGGGLGATRFLARCGARVLVTDTAGETDLRDALDALAEVDVEFRLGEHVEDDLDDADLLVVSPAVNRRTSGFFRAARQRGVPWTTEMNLFVARCPARVIAVSGSLGKSTTCAMLHTILQTPTAARSAGFRRSFLGGNIGQSLLEHLEDIGADDLVVLEMSSFQLEATPGVEFRPDVAGLTNVLPHHLERHGGFEAYLDVKLNLFRYQREGDAAVVGATDALVRGRVREIAARRASRFVAAAQTGRRYELAVPGAHNQANAHLAVALAEACGVAEDIARDALGAFTGLAHRLQFVGTIGGVRYYNDSKSTAVEAVSAALRSFEEPLVVLCGGKDTGSDLHCLVEGPWRHVRAVLCFGDAGARLSASLDRQVCPRHGCEVRRLPGMADAVLAARSVARAGDVVLLSPGFPSYDEFVNYEERGETFMSMVRASG